MENKDIHGGFNRVLNVTHKTCHDTVPEYYPHIYKTYVDTDCVRTTDDNAAYIIDTIKKYINQKWGCKND